MGSHTHSPSSDDDDDVVVVELEAFFSLFSLDSLDPLEFELVSIVAAVVVFSFDDLT